MESLARKMEKIIAILELVIIDLKEIRAELKAFETVMAQKTPKTTVEPVEKREETAMLETTMEPLTIEKVQSMLSEDLLAKLYFEDSGDSIIIKPREFLGHDAFRELARIACDRLGGTYYSEEKNNRFVIPKRKNPA